MKILTIAFLLPLSFYLNAQDKVSGQYFDYFGHHIELNTDNTFKYTWNFDLKSSWTKGTWILKGDTVYFNIILVYDTLRHVDIKNTIQEDTLLLSTDDKAELIVERFSINSQNSKPIPIRMVSFGGGQNSQPPPYKLCFKDNRLIGIDSTGNLIVGRQKGIWTTETYDPWFIKMVNH